MQILNSIVVPARNVEKTLACTLRSLFAQTNPHWQCIIVDDASTDSTGQIAADFAARDTRISVIPGAGAGVAAARNKGIARANGHHLLFLDSDDWIAPQLLETLGGLLDTNPEAVAAYCAYQRVTPEGRFVRPHWSSELAKTPFEIMARCMDAVVHSILVRRALIDAVGGFDETLRTCEDWDFWQRVARTGGKFIGVREPLAFYRMTSGSLSKNPALMIPDASRVIARGFSSDDRVKSPSNFAKGADPNYGGGPELALACFVVWSAAQDVGSERPFEYAFETGRMTDFKNDVRKATGSIFEGLWLGANCLPSEVIKMWPKLEGGLSSLLKQIENRSSRLGLERRLRYSVERDILQAADIQGVSGLGVTAAARFELLRPAAIVPPPNADRLLISYTAGGKRLGMGEMPVYGVVSVREAAWLAFQKMKRKVVSYFGKRLGRRIWAGLVLKAVSIPTLTSVMAGRPSPRDALPASGKKSHSSNRATIELMVEAARAEGKRKAADATLLGPINVSQKYLGPAQARQDVGNRASKEMAGASVSKTTNCLPILLYHQISDEGPAALSRYRTGPSMFRAQISWLRDNGYYSVCGAEAVGRLCRGEGFSGRPVLITFDDATVDFFDKAWPLLRDVGFTAEVFVVTDMVGGYATWDSEYGQPAALMTATQIADLARSGVGFGSHLATHRAADALSSVELLAEMARSRAMLDVWTSKETASLALPYGVCDERVRYLARECGYQAVFTTDEGVARDGVDPLCLPRLEVQGGWDLDRFVAIMKAAGGV